jgi:uracil-DNA glycosylase
MIENLSTAEILRWQLDAGVDETIGNEPVNRFAEAPLTVAPTATKTLDKPPPKQPVRAAEKPRTPQGPVVAEKLLHDACEIAAAAGSIDELRQALVDYDGCALKKNATNLVFGDGNPKAKVVLIGEGPGAEEDRQGLPFVGPSGQLLDKMLASIGLDRQQVYISNTVFWRPPGNRTPTTAETALCMPFVERLMELIDPEILITLGGPAAKVMLAETAGVGRLRGKWYAYSTPKLSRPVQATALFHPAYLLRSPAHKREAWRDLLMIRDKLDELG